MQLHNSLSEQIYDSLKSKILSGELQGGMPIPEEAIAAQFGVSRTPIREALRRLSEYGLVMLRPHSNAKVCTINEKQAKDIARVRLNLELMAIDHLDQETFNRKFMELSKIAADCNVALAQGNRAKVLETDSLFHITLVCCSNNSALIRLYERMDAQNQLVRFIQCPQDERLAYYIGQHTTILQHILTNDIRSCKDLLREHITHDLF